MTTLPIDRREFLLAGAAACASASLAPALRASSLLQETPPLFRISLAQWSLHRELFAVRLHPLDFAKAARETYGIDAIEYVTQFYIDKARVKTYVEQMKKRADDHGVRSLLIMIDGEGQIGHSDEHARDNAIDAHKIWVEAAKTLGCHSVRVNAGSQGTPEEQRDHVAEGLRRLCEFADPLGINVIVENHGGLSSNGAWLASVMRTVDHPRCGTLPDFGNFRISGETWYDRYEGVRELMPFAKAVSAKSHDFDDEGDETSTDYMKMMRIVLDAGYDGYVGIEYEGDRLSEHDGILATKALLERVREALAKERAAADDEKSENGR